MSVNPDNFIRVKVVTGCEDQNPLTQLQAQAAKMKHRFSGETRSNQEFNGVIPNDKAFKNLLKIADQTKDIEEIPLEEKTKQKWLVTQGGTFSMETLTANLGEYFEPRECDAEPSDKMLQVAQYLNVICNCGDASKVKLIQTNPRMLYSCWKPKKSYAGATYDGDRRTPGVASMAIKQAIDAPYNIDYTIAGMRNKDGKYRNIFMDSFANYFRESMFLSEIFERWHSLSFDSNQGDMPLAAEIRKLRAKCCYCGDYKAMDQHQSYDASVNTLIYVCFWFGYDYSQIMKIIFWLKDLAEQCILVGDELWIPKWCVNLLSGLYPTHDLEGMENVLILSSTAVDCGLRVVTKPRPLKRGECYIKVCGDDSVVFFGDESVPDDFATRHAENAAHFGQIMELSKVDKSKTTAWFCKKKYALRDDVAGFEQVETEYGRLCVPKYSLMKAINALRRPENVPTMPNYHDLIIWTASIMDNCAGMKMYKSVIYQLVQCNPTLFSVENVSFIESYKNRVPEDVEEYLRQDWWTNETWSANWLATSPTLRLIYKIILKK